MPDIPPQASQLQKRIEQNIEEARMRKIEWVPAAAEDWTKEVRLPPLPEPDITRDVSSPRPVIGPVLVLIRKLLRWSLRPFFGRQILVNEAVARQFLRIDRFVAELRVTLDHLAVQVDRLERQDLDLKRQVFDVRRQILELKSQATNMDRCITEDRASLNTLQDHAATYLPKLLAVTPRSPAPMQVVETGFASKGDQAWYPPISVGPSTIASRATNPDTVRKVLDIMRRLHPDPVIEYLSSYYQHGLSKFKGDWRFADIATAVVAIGELINPATYLEVGVFHGRTMALMGAVCPTCAMYGFDLWIQDYAGLGNPGPEYVRDQLKRVGHVGSVVLTSGNSHETLPQFFAQNPELYFDVITVDGDHTGEGATQDLLDVIPRLKIGGVLVFDDLAHTEARYAETKHLAAIWSRIVATDPRFSSWQFTELGNGVAIAVKHWG